MSDQRIVCWFSHGAASAVATKMAIEQNNISQNRKQLVIVSIFIKEEHEDNERFRRECEYWFGQKIEIITSDKYKSSVSEVIKQTKYMSGVAGARCTKELKKQVRLDWQRHDDIHVFGMTSEEEHRIDRLIDSENNIQVMTPLIDLDMSKNDCFMLLEQNNITLPMMYHLGYPNNNCKGCTKVSSVGYWNKIRVDFPDIFNQRSHEEKLLNVALCKMSLKKFKNLHYEYYKRMKDDHDQGLVKWSVDNRGGLRIPLRYLPPDAGALIPIYVPDCGFFCEKEEY